MIHHLGARLARSGLAAGLLAAAFAAAAQKIDDVPPAVQNSVAPNFMFMVDTSGSMNNIVPAAPYSAAATYQSSCTGSNITMVSTASTVELRVQNGNPRVRAGGTTLVHVSLRPNTSTSAFCFNNTATYSAKLLANGGTASDRVPDNNYLDAEYSGHFLNWYFGSFDSPATGWTDRKRLNAGVVETRMEIAKRSAKSAIDNLPVPASGRTAVRAGLTTYSTSPLGGALRIAMGDLTATTRTALKNSIDNLTPAGATPLAGTLADIGRYMASGYTGNVSTARENNVPIDDLLYMRGADTPAGGRNACLAGAPNCRTTTTKPIQYWCQRTSIFALTDGRPQSDRVFEGQGSDLASTRNNHVFDYDGDCSGVNASTCQPIAGQPNPSNLPRLDRKNNRSYESNGSDFMDDVAKLLFDTDLRPDLQPTRGTKTSKNNISTYMIGFADTTVQNDPLLISTARQGGGKFIAATDGAALDDAFRDVITDALGKDAAAAAVAVTNTQITSGTVGYASSYNSGSWWGELEAYALDPATGLQNGPVQWSARDKLNLLAPGSRKIASFNASNGVPFTTANFPGIDANLLNYVRGDRSREGNPFAVRAHVLGDIINAEPVVVNYTAVDPVVFQAANDGMLHAFDGRVAASASTRGQELWAYLPRLVHGSLASRADPFTTHQYLMDATPAAAEITGFGSVGRILVGGLGKGGSGYYALNVTSGTAASEAAAANQVLWESRLANMGYSFGTPLIVRTAAGWRVVVASGLRNDTGIDGLGGDGRGHVWVLNPGTGAVEKEFTTPAGFGSAGAGLGLAYLATASNVNPSALVRYVWGADLLGNVWRFDLDAASGNFPVQVAELRDPSGNRQPVTAPPVVNTVAGSATKFFIYLGTGQYFSVDDVPGTSTPNSFATQTQTIYGIVDDTSDASPSLPGIRHTGGTCPSNGGNGDFACQTATGSGTSFTVSHNTVDLTRKRGFYLDIPIAGGRVNTQVAVTAGGTLVVVVNKPTNEICNPGGSSFFFQLSAVTGGAIPKTVGGTEFYDSVFVVADALSSRPVIVTTAGRPRGLLRLSDKTTQSREIDETAISTFRRIYMRPLN